MKPFALAALFTAAIAASALGSGDWGDQEPRTLDAYLDRLPAKSVGRIFEETLPGDRRWLAAPDIAKALRALVEKIQSEPVEKSTAEVDKLLAVTRMARAHEQAPASECPRLPARYLNLLHDVRDALGAVHEFVLVHCTKS